MEDIIQLNLLQFSMIYLLLLVILFIMKKSKINQTKLLLIASFRMTIQLILAGLILTYIFGNPHPLFTIAYLLLMVIFSIRQVLSKNKDLNFYFKLVVALSIALCGIFIIFFFVLVVTRMSVFNPQYTIPISGMIIGNSMTGVTLGLITFSENLKSQRSRIETLLNLGVTPKGILIPLVNNSLEKALLPTLNSMLSMGIISLPGMMTGQILAGTLPLTAIMYQIAIMIAICTAVCLTVFCSLNLGYKTLYNSRKQFLFLIEEKKSLAQ